MSVPLQSPGGPCSPLMDPADRVPGGGGVSAARVWPASSRPCQIPEALLRGRVPPDEQNKFMEMFSQGRFSSAGLRFREKHRLEGKQSWLLRGSKHRLPCPSPAPTALLPLPLFPAPPSVPGRPEDAAPRVQGVPQKQATGTPGARETGPCLRASVSGLGSPPSELSPLSSDQARWPGGEKGGPS